MRLLLTAAIVLGIAAATFVGVRIWQFRDLWPKPSAEVVELTSAKRALLQRLRAETKFAPNDYPPLGYTGPETLEDRTRGTAAVNGVIDAVLAHPDGPLSAKIVASHIGKGMREVGTLATEDRDRTQGYMVEVWYLLGFKGPTGRFAYGSAFPLPNGYGEPLPPGWAAPDRPRPIS